MTKLRESETGTFCKTPPGVWTGWSAAFRWGFVYKLQNPFGTRAGRDTLSTAPGFTGTLKNYCWLTDRLILERAMANRGWRKQSHKAPHKREAKKAQKRETVTEPARRWRELGVGAYSLLAAWGSRGGSTRPFAWGSRGGSAWPFGSLRLLEYENLPHTTHKT